MQVKDDLLLQPDPASVAVVSTNTNFLCWSNGQCDGRGWGHGRAEDDTSSTEGQTHTKALA